MCSVKPILGLSLIVGASAVEVEVQEVNLCLALYQALDNSIVGSLPLILQK